MKVLNFIINEIFGQGAIFLALIALIGLLLQKKSFSEIVRGTLMTANTPQEILDIIQNHLL